MKYFLILNFLILNVSFSFAQKNDALDLKNGFKHFVLGSSPSQIMNIVRDENQYSKNPEVKSYYYVGDDIEYIFNVKVDAIKLDFFKDKLFSIHVSFGNQKNQIDFEVEEFNLILNSLERTYGKNWFKLSNEDNVLTNGVYWEGSKVELELVRIDFSKSKSNPHDYGYISGYISVYDKKLMDDMYKSDF